MKAEVNGKVDQISSVELSSDLHLAGFGELMPKTFANATVDRLMHHAHVALTAATASASPKPPPARG